MSSALEKSLSVIELLVEHPEGLSVGEIAVGCGLPASGTHRILQELSRHGYVRQAQSHGAYMLSIKLPSLGLGFLARAGVTDIAQPILDRLATESHELVRLSVRDTNGLVWVAVAQGATGGLRYDPGREQGVVVHLASTAGGRAFLSTLDDSEAVRLVGMQGLVPPGRQQPGQHGLHSFAELLAVLAETRRRGYSIAVDGYIVGMAAMAMPVRYRDGGAIIGCLSIAGPAVRMTPERMDDLAPKLAAATTELGAASQASLFFRATMRDDALAGAIDRRIA